eukprot:TRINITY_DN11404_c0_g1_i2.p1 TRINITY_DN11404_c0_g1~~TRINITY_DN11404_c0_g1_i2.p1  ORF type:complete len:446 (-),score=106.59 TRINITY_DN11404_c0_g1_i2:220-1557(-)
MFGLESHTFMGAHVSRIHIFLRLVSAFNSSCVQMFNWHSGAEQLQSIALYLRVHRLGAKIERISRGVVLFGSSPAYCIEAAVLGKSLQATGTPHSMVLLHTDDVPRAWLPVLAGIGWELKQVEYLEGKGRYDGSSGGRFQGVFTKLHAIGLTEYEKVVLLDADLLVRHNIDELFDRQAPAALRRHAAADYPDGAQIPSDELMNERGELKSGINAGVMVLNTSKQDFQKMKLDLEVECDRPSRMPEQDYLTEFYVRDWHALGVRFNFQPHQLAFTDRRGLETCRRLTTPLEEISVAHFSAVPKPRDWLQDTHCGVDRETYAKEVLYRNYLKGMDKDRRPGCQVSALPFGTVEDQLQSATVRLAMDWWNMWDRLVEDQPEAEELRVAWATAPAEPSAKPKSSSGGFKRWNRWEPRQKVKFAGKPSAARRLPTAIGLAPAPAPKRRRT